MNESVIKNFDEGVEFTRKYVVDELQKIKLRLDEKVAHTGYIPGRSEINAKRELLWDLIQYFSQCYSLTDFKKSDIFKGNELFKDMKGVNVESLV